MWSMILTRRALRLLASSVAVGDGWRGLCYWISVSGLNEGDSTAASTWVSGLNDDQMEN